MSEKDAVRTVRWYLRPLVIFLMILALGPFALPLVWMSPFFKRWQKIMITLFLVLLTAWVVKSGVELYEVLLKEFKSLSEIS